MMIKWWIIVMIWVTMLNLSNQFNQTWNMQALSHANYSWNVAIMSKLCWLFNKFFSQGINVLLNYQHRERIVPQQCHYLQYIFAIQTCYDFSALDNKINETLPEKVVHSILYRSLRKWIYSTLDAIHKNFKSLGPNNGEMNYLSFAYMHFVLQV